MKPTVYNVLELDARHRPNRIRGMFVATRGDPPVIISKTNIAIEEVYRDDIPFWLEIASVPH